MLKAFPALKLQRKEAMNKIPALMAVWLSSALVGSAHAQNFFEPCDAALKTAPYKSLREYLQAHEAELVPDMCFRLSNSEFLLTVTDAPRISQGLYHYDAKANKFDLSDGRSRPNVRVKREFEGKAKKRFVLLSWSNLHQGDWSSGYEILNLIPKKEDRSFVVYGLLGVSEDPQSGFCGSNSVARGKTDAVKAVRVLHEGTENVQIVFEITEQDCSTKKFRVAKRVFSLNDGIFTYAAGL
jgi:hypothetical protein